MPFFMRTPALLLYRTYVSGLSLDLLDAENLMKELSLKEYEVSRVPNLPALMMIGQKS